jgi:hypothetical protein
VAGIPQADNCTARRVGDPLAAYGRRALVHSSRDKAEDVPGEAQGDGNRKPLALHALGAVTPAGSGGVARPSRVSRCLEHGPGKLEVALMQLRRARLAALQHLALLLEDLLPIHHSGAVVPIHRIGECS